MKFAFNVLPRLFLLMLSLCTLSNLAKAADDPMAPLGSNLTAINDFSDEFPFINLMKSSRDWIPGNASGCFDCREAGTNPSCNAPNACPVTINRDSDGYASSLLPNQLLRTLIYAGDGVPSGRFKTGTYTMRFDGQGAVSFFGASNVQNSDANTITFDVNASNINIGFNLTATTNGNHLRNIRILPPGGVCSNDARRVCDAITPCADAAICQLFATNGVAETQIFHPTFINNVAPYRVLRYMDWMETNNSPVVNFADYPDLNDVIWHRVPVAILAELGNRIGSDIWVNIPHLASNEFVDQFATLLRDEFRTDRKIFVEYSNENWNGIFRQNLEIPRAACPSYADLASDCQQDGVPGNGIACEIDPNTFSVPAPAGSACFQALLRRWGDRSVEIFDRFDTAFGANVRDRVERVVAAQAANPDLGRQVLVRGVTGGGPTVSSKTDAYAVAPYFGTEYCTPSSGINPDSHPSVYASLDDFFADLNSRALPTSIGFMTGNKTMLNNNFNGSGIRLVGYEGGQHLAGIGGFTFNASCNDTFDAANADPRMGTLYANYLAAWKQNGDELVHFYNVGRWGVFGRWGLKEFQDQTRASSPKFDALMDFSEANPCWWPFCVPVVLLAPNAQLTPASLSFNATPNQTTTTQFAQLTNTGNVNLTVNAIAIAPGAGNGVFNLSGGTCQAGVTSLAATASCTVGIAFTGAATAPNTTTAQLNVTTNDPDVGGIVSTGLTGNTSSTAVLCGDANGDTAVNIVDALLIARFDAGFNPTPFNATAADVNVPPDGASIVDALLVARFDAGLPVTGTCLTPP